MKQLLVSLLWFAEEKVCFAKVVVANKKVKCMLNF
jgi:hypothetical protein